MALHRRVRTASRVSRQQVVDVAPKRFGRHIVRCRFASEASVELSHKPGCADYLFIVVLRSPITISRDPPSRIDDAASAPERGALLNLSRQSTRQGRWRELHQELDFRGLGECHP